MRPPILDYITADDIKVVPDTADDADLDILNTLLEESPEVQAVVAKTIEAAYERGLRFGERAGREEKQRELARLADGIARSTHRRG